MPAPVVHSVMEMNEVDELGEAIEDVFDASEGFEIELEETLQTEYDFQTLLKANTFNFNEYSQRYNMICGAFSMIADNKEITRLHAIRFEARRRALDGDAILLTVSPYTDEGAAICYGYVEGSREVASAGYQTASGRTVNMPTSIDLVNGDF